MKYTQYSASYLKNKSLQQSLIAEENFSKEKVYRGNNMNIVKDRRSTNVIIQSEANYLLISDLISLLFLARRIGESNE